jgi:hypothetical protein
LTLRPLTKPPPSPSRPERSLRVSFFQSPFNHTLLTDRRAGEVEDLKDSIGGGETLDNEAGVTTRGADQDAYAQEKKVDQLDL